MSRIRTIKPEFWTSGQVLECSRDARLLFIGLWNFCDDAGRHPLRPKQIKAQLFPADDDMSSETIRRIIDELSSNGLIHIYAVGDEEFFEVTGWMKHQRIDRPHPGKYPPPIQEDSDNSTNARRTLDDHSIPIGKDTKGKDTTGKEKIGEERKGGEWGGKGRNTDRASSSALEGTPTRSDGSEQVSSQGDEASWLVHLPAKRREAVQAAFERSGRDPLTGERVTG